MKVKIACAVPTIIEGDMDRNFDTILNFVDKAVLGKAELVLFPEMAFSGFRVSNDFEDDVKCAVELDSPYIRGVQDAARKGSIWIGISFLEHDAGNLHDSAVLVNDAGEIVLHYRRMSKGWTWQNPPETYVCGDTYPTADTPWGKVGFLICGDIFEVAWEHAAKADLDLVLCPVACSFDFEQEGDPQADWDANYWHDYAAQFAKVGATAIMTNYVDKIQLFHGGAYIADPAGNLLHSMPIYQEGLLIAEGGI